MAVWRTRSNQYFFRCFRNVLSLSNLGHKILQMDPTQNQFTRLKYISLKSILILSTPILTSSIVPSHGGAEEKQTRKPSLNRVSLRA
jgi:hypothetical protein